MENEPITNEPETTDPETPTEEPTTEDPGNVEPVYDPETDPEFIFPIENREYTPFVTGEGTINVIHEITLGDLLLSTLVLALLSFIVISRFVRR